MLSVSKQVCSVHVALSLCFQSQERPKAGRKTTLTTLTETEKENEQKGKRRRNSEEGVQDQHGNPRSWTSAFRVLYSVQGSLKPGISVACVSTRQRANAYNNKKGSYRLSVYRTWVG